MIRRTSSIITAAAAVTFSLVAWYSDTPALASSGFLGTWCGWSMRAYTINDFPRLQVKQGVFTETDAHYSGAQFVAEHWGQTGTLSSDGSKIVWSDGNVW